MMALSMGFRSSDSLLPAIRATRLLASALAGLSPAERANTHPIRLILSTLRRSKHVASAQIDSCSISLNHLCARQLDPRPPRSCRSSRYPALHGFDPITTADFELSAKFKHYVRIFTYCHLRRGRQTAVRRSEISGRRDRHLHRQLNS